MNWKFPPLKQPNEFPSYKEYLEYIRNEIRTLAEVCDRELEEFKQKRKEDSK